MFDGEKTRIFWWGLMIFGTAVSALFWILWNVYLTYSASYRYGSDLRYSVPPLFACVVFLLIGYYMMKSGVLQEHS